MFPYRKDGLAVTWHGGGTSGDRPDPEDGLRELEGEGLKLWGAFEAGAFRSSPYYSYLWLIYNDKGLFHRYRVLCEMLPQLPCQLLCHMQWHEVMMSGIRTHSPCCQPFANAMHMFFLGSNPMFRE